MVAAKEAVENALGQAFETLGEDFRGRRTELAEKAMEIRPELRAEIPEFVAELEQALNQGDVTARAFLAELNGLVSAA